MSEINSGKNELYPVVAIRDGIVFPSAENVLVFGREKNVACMKHEMKTEKKVILVMQKRADLEDPESKDLYDIGVVAQIDKIATSEKGQINALVKGLYKVHI